MPAILTLVRKPLRCLCFGKRGGHVRAAYLDGRAPYHDAPVHHLHGHRR